MAETVEVGVVGCGFFARFHLHAWRDLAVEGARLVAVCDIDAAKTEAVARDFGGLRCYTDAATMMESEKLGLVDIATRMETHRALVDLAVRHRLPTVVQKPMAPTWEDCVAMVEAAAAAGIFFAVHENFRFQAPLLRLKAIVDSGEVGTPNWARISLRTGRDVYANQPYFYAEERLAILDSGIHMLDLARYFMGEVRRVSCETQQRNPRVRAEDTATMMLKHTSGAVSLVECTYENRRSDAIETVVEIEASTGGVDLLADGVIVVTTNAGRREEKVPHPTIAWARAPMHFVQDSVLATCRHMLGAIRGGRAADTNGHDSLKTFALVEAAYRAAESGCATAPVI